MNAEPLVLVVEDEPQMRRFLRTSLGAHQFKVVEAATSAEALALATERNPELVLLDLGLPDGDGLDVLRALRGWSQAAIIVLSARGREEDKVRALDDGADDYLTKPFGMNELLARIRVALRHVQSRGQVQGPVLVYGKLRVDLARREVFISERALHLTPIEYKLITLLAQNAGKVLTHRQILKEVWGPSALNQPHYVRVHMAQLRKKVEADPARPELIITEPGVGYRLRDDAR